MVLQQPILSWVSHSAASLSTIPSASGHRGSTREESDEEDGQLEGPKAWRPPSHWLMIHEDVEGWVAPTLRAGIVCSGPQWQLGQHAYCGGGGR